MTERDLIKNSIDETHSKPPIRNHSTDKIIYSHIDEKWSFDLADTIDYKISNNKGFRYMFVILDNITKYTWGIPLKSKNNQTITRDISNILIKSKRSPVKLESDRGAEIYNSIIQKFLKSKSKRPYSRFTDKGPSIAERVIRNIRKLLK